MPDYPSILMEAESQLEHLCQLNIDEPNKHRRLTGIVCTIARETQNMEKLEQMIMAGMNIARINCSHDSQEFHTKSIRMIRAACTRCSRRLGHNLYVAIALDLKGPEIRTGGLDRNKEFDLRKNTLVRLSINKDFRNKGNREIIYVDYKNIINVAQQGSRVYINDGEILLIVREVGVDCLICVVVIGGRMGPYKTVRMPEVSVDLPITQEKDRVDIKFGLEHNIEMIFVPGVKHESHVEEIRTLLGDRGRDVKVIAKVEYAEAIKRLDEILKVSDGILFARGDLVIQIPIQRIFLVQKAVIARCNRAGKPVICATQILESMRYNALPTRAEINDLGNVILDGADCVMLSSETAVGRYPIEALEMMATICREAESALWYKNISKDLIKGQHTVIDATHSVSIAAVDAAKKTMASAIIVLTTTDKCAAAISKYRPRCPIFVCTRRTTYAKQMHLYRGIIPIVFPDPEGKNWVENTEARLHFVLLIAKKMKVVRGGDAIVLVTAWKDSDSGFTNNMRVIYTFFEKPPIESSSKTDKKMPNRLL